MGEPMAASEALHWRAYTATDSRVGARRAGTLALELSGTALTLRDDRGEQTFDIASAPLGIAPWEDEPACGAVLEIGDSRPLLIGGLDAFALGLDSNRPPRAEVDVYLRRPDFAELIRAVLDSRAAAAEARRGDAGRDAPYRSAKRDAVPLLSLVRVTRALSAPNPEPRSIALVDSSFDARPLALLLLLIPLNTRLDARGLAWLTPIATAFLALVALWLTRRPRRWGEISTGSSVELRQPDAGHVRARVKHADVALVEGHWAGWMASGPALEMRIGGQARLVIGTRGWWAAERARWGPRMNPTVEVDSVTWLALRRAFEDRLG